MHFLSQMSVLIPLRSYELHCVPATKMPCLRLPASHSSPWPTVEAIYNWVAVSGLRGFLCSQSWVEPLSVTLDSECHVKACGLIVLAWQKVEISEDLYRDNLHCCFAFQLQWATTCGLDPYIIGFKLSLFATMSCWVLFWLKVYAQLCVMETMQYETSQMYIESDWWEGPSWV